MQPRDAPRGTPARDTPRGTPPRDSPLDTPPHERRSAMPQPTDGRAAQPNSTTGSSVGSHRVPTLLTHSHDTKCRRGGSVTTSGIASWRRHRSFFYAETV